MPIPKYSSSLFGFSTTLLLLLRHEFSWLRSAFQKNKNDSFHWKIITWLLECTTSPICDTIKSILCKFFFFFVYFVHLAHMVGVVVVGLAGLVFLKLIITKKSPHLPTTKIFVFILKSWIFAHDAQVSIIWINAWIFPVTSVSFVIKLCFLYVVS